MKSANCISATGRMPSMAAPTAAPTMADSARGVSHTRSAPNSSMNPSVTLNAPPNAPMSSPRQNTDSSARISSRRPSEIACRYVISGMSVHPLANRGPARPRRLPVADLQAREPVEGRTLDGVDGELVVVRRRIRELVVLEYEDDGQPP